MADSRGSSGSVAPAMADDDQHPIRITRSPTGRASSRARTRAPHGPHAAPHESRDFRLLFLGKSISDLRRRRSWRRSFLFQVYQLTHSTLAVGMLGLCELVPVFVFPHRRRRRRRRCRRAPAVWSIVMHALLAVMSALMAVNAALPRSRTCGRSYVFATLSAGLYTFNRPASSTWPARLLSGRAATRRRTRSKPGSNTVAGMQVQHSRRADPDDPPGGRVPRATSGTFLRRASRWCGGCSRRRRRTTTLGQLVRRSSTVSGS